MVKRRACPGAACMQERGGESYLTFKISVQLLYDHGIINTTCVVLEYGQNGLENKFRIYIYLPRLWRTRSPVYGVKEKK